MVDASSNVSINSPHCDLNLQSNVDNSDGELTYVILRDINKTPCSTPTSFLADYRDKNRASILIQELINNGHLKISGDVISVTEKGNNFKKELFEKRQEKKKNKYISIYKKVFSDFSANNLSEQYKKVVAKSECQKCAALIIADSINGSVGNISWKKEICSDYKKHETSAKYEQSKVRIEKELLQMKSSGIDKFEITALSSKPQKETCTKCKSMNGKIFSVNSAVIGVNCPPFHEGCRCDILSVLPDEKDLDKEWDDFVKKHVPDGMTFDEWLDHLEPTSDGYLTFQQDVQQNTNVQSKNIKSEKSKSIINKIALFVRKIIN